MIQVQDVGDVPGLTGLAHLVAPWEGSTAFIVEYGRHGAVPLGNNGDKLLNAVFELILPELGITVVRDVRRADLLLVRPGGALLDRYHAPQMLERRLSELPDLPLVIFPSSSWFASTSPVHVFGSRKAPTLWICREPYTYAHLDRQWGRSLNAASVTLALDHDVVVSGHHHIRRVLGLDKAAPRVNDGPLLVARLGAEAGRMGASGGTPTPSRKVGVGLLRRLPAAVQISVRRHTTSQRQMQANEKMMARLGSAAPTADLSRWSFDISDPTLATFRSYSGAIARSASVATDRLHVALPSTLLGKPTHLVESGYHKLRGVYEHSLKGLPNISFLPFE